MPDKKRKTDEDRLKELQARIDKRKKMADAKADLEKARKALNALRTKKK